MTRRFRGQELEAGERYPSAGLRESDDIPDGGAALQSRLNKDWYPRPVRPATAFKRSQPESLPGQAPGQGRCQPARSGRTRCDPGG
jgi:hypothetical protein